MQRRTEKPAKKKPIFVSERKNERLKNLFAYPKKASRKLGGKAFF